MAVDRARPAGRMPARGSEGHTLAGAGGGALATAATQRCPKCGSQAYEADHPCLICGCTVFRQRTAAEQAAWASRFGVRAQTSEQRLDAAFGEMDRRYGEGTEKAMPDEAKVYRCSACEETFPSRQALAGHGNSRKHQERVASGPGSPASASTLGGHPEQVREPDAPPENGRELFCPTCAHPLPAMVQVVAEDFAQEGVDEELAAMLAAKACGLLRAPA